MADAAHPTQARWAAWHWAPLHWARARIRHWFEARLPRRDTQELTQRNVYILPSRAGWMLLLTLIVLLVAAINYQINLGYLLTFMLAGAATVGMYSCHGNLRGATLHLQPPAPAFAGEPARLVIELINPRTRPRYGLGLAVLDAAQWAWVDIPAQGRSTVELAWHPQQRGWQTCPTLSAETRWPLGTFRVWTVWCPAARILVYPQPEAKPPPLPMGQPSAGRTHTSAERSQEEWDGVRPYRRGDALKTIVWKKMAKSDALVSRDSHSPQHTQLWLDYQDAGAGLTPEERLSRLTAWVVLAHRRDLHYGLRLPRLTLAPNSGWQHREQCLQALALA